MNDVIPTDLNNTDLPTATCEYRPAERFYWAILDASILTQSHSTPLVNLRRRPTPVQLSYLFDAFLPLPVESLQVMYHRIAPNSYLACGIEKTILSDFIKDHPDTLILTPETIPACITESISKDSLSHSTIQADSINLLTGEFEPRQISSQRRSYLMNLAVAILLSGIFIIIGLERRRAVLVSQGEQVSSAQTAIYQHVLNPAGSMNPSLNQSTTNPVSQLAAARFTGELRRLRQTRQVNSSSLSTAQVDASGPPAAETLNRLFAAWPVNHNLHMQTETISVTESALTIIGTLPTPDQAQQFSADLKSFDPKHWRARQPAISASSRNESVRLTLRYEHLQPQQGTPPGDQSRK